MQTTPISLLERIRARSEKSAWAELVDLYSPFIRKQLGRHGVPPADADDICQDVFVVLLHELPGFEHSQNKGAFRRWLRSTIYHRLLGYWRSRRNGRTNSISNISNSMIANVADSGADWDLHWNQEHDEFILNALMKRVRTEFTDGTWLAFQEQVISGRKPADVAARMGMSVNSVIIAKSRVLRRLRQEADGLIDDNS